MTQTSDSDVFDADTVARFAKLGVDLHELFSAGHLGTRMGIEITRATADLVTGTMPVDGNTQPYGLLHGGASAALAETLGSIGAMLHAGPGGIAVGVDLNVTHHRSARSGIVTGEARPVHLGRSAASYEVVITNDEGKRICTGRITCFIRDNSGK